MSAVFVLKDGGTLIYCSPSPGVHTELGDFPGLALMDLMKPYMPATPDNYQRVLRDIHAQAMERHGPESKVIVLPFARYQLPRNMVRLEAEPFRFPQEAHA